jgi:hypothetical protein
MSCGRAGRQRSAEELARGEDRSSRVAEEGSDSPPGQALSMTLDDVDAYLLALDGCRARTVDGRRAWFVDGLLVARADAPGTLLVRVGGDDRERLVTAYPGTYGVPPRWEAHAKVQADLTGDPDAVREGLHRAWEVQRAARA